MMIEPLTARELEILRLIAEGLTNREIAQKLHLSPETVKWHNTQSFGKLAASNRTEAVAQARELELLDGDKLRQAEIIPSGWNNLPAELSSFVGREEELAEVRALLQKARLVTLTGTGGTGKTRLAIQVARAEVEGYPDGIAYVPLADVTDGRQVADKIAQELEVSGRADRSTLDSLKGYFRNKQLLLLLDNFEHVLSAAPMVIALLAAAPHLSVLTTSREALRLSGEHEYLVPPLTVPILVLDGSVTELLAYESVALFVQRAGAASTEFRLTGENAGTVAGICLLLDGLPLAIELAAARIKLFNPQQMLQRLESRLGLLTGGPRDLPVRQRTLRDTIDWSYNLLDEDEKKLFARLAVFTGGLSLEAVEAICDPELGVDAVDGLESLLNKSLLYQTESPGGESRFIMLETIHEFAHERLAESGEVKLIRNRHLDYFRELAEEMEPGYRRHNQVFLLERTKVEFGNLRAAFEWALDSQNVEAAARLISSIDYYFQYAGNLVEGYHWFKRVKGEIDKIPKKYQIRFLLGVKRLAWVGDTPEQDMLLGRQALALAREFGERPNEAWLLANISYSLTLPEEYEAAVEMNARALAIFRELDDKPGMAFTFNALGEVERLSGNHERAKEAYEKTLAISRETGEIYRQSMNLANLAFVAYDQGEYERGRKLAIAILNQRIEIGWVEWAFIGLMVIAGPLGKLGQPEKAARLLGASTNLSAEMGIYFQPGDQPVIDKYIADVRAQLDEATFETARAEGQAMTLKQAVTYALSDS